jgi:hypothetical protein
LSKIIWDTTFDGNHNSQITWEHLLNQSSDWSGTLWGDHVGQTGLLVKEVLTIGKIELFPFLELNLNTMM